MSNTRLLTTIGIMKALSNAGIRSWVSLTRRPCTISGFMPMAAPLKPKPTTRKTRQVVMPFGHIAAMFAAGDFSAPMLIHEQNPPGTEEMRRLREAIQYSVENTELGARI